MYKFGLKRKITLLEVDIASFISVFHQWIQEDEIPNHIMVDVADYKHIPNGPGIMLIAFEGNFSIGYDENGLGLSYIRKTKIGSNETESLENIQKILDNAVRLIKNDSMLRKKIKFSNEYSVFSNDRYEYPNNVNSENKLHQLVSSVFDDSILLLNNSYNDSRLTIHIKKEIQ